MIRVEREIVMKRLAAVIAILVLCSNVYATLVELDNAPSWRGDEGSTYQAWSFTDPTVPDVVDNGYGGVTLSVTDNSATTVHMPGYIRPGVWMITWADWMIINIDNTDITGPDTWKEIWLQVIYNDPEGDGSNPLPILTDPLYAWEDFERQPLEDLGDGYVLDTYKIILKPNPTEEMIKFTSIQYKIYVSAIAVDTKCVPEPTAICLFGLGALGLLRKRRA